MNRITVLHLLAEYGPGTSREIGTKAGLKKMGNLSGKLRDVAKPGTRNFATQKKIKGGKFSYAINKAGQEYLATSKETLFTVEQINDGQDSIRRKETIVQMDPKAESAVNGIVALVEDNKRLRSEFQLIKIMIDNVLAG